MTWNRELKLVGEGEPRDINGPIDEHVPTGADPTNPDHYKKGDIEVIDLTRHLGFREGNIVKYAARHKEKGGKEDILKLIWYAQDILRTDYSDNSIEHYNGC